MLFGIVGAKRVLFFLYPVTFIGIYYLGFVKGKKTSFIKQFGLTFVLVTGIVLVQIYMMKNIESLNPEGKPGGNIIYNYNYVFDFAKKYETAHGVARGSAGGRASTIALTFKTLFEAGLAQILFGFGPGAATSSELDDNKHIDERIYSYVGSYGKTGMTQIVVEYGLFGLFIISPIFLIFIIRSYKWFSLENETYWKAISMGTIIFTLLQSYIYFFYNTTSITNITIVPVYFYVMSLMSYRLNMLMKTTT